MTAPSPTSPAAAPRRVLVAKPRGYCAGVDRAVLTVEKALEAYGAPVYVRKQIVHNAHVVRTLEAQGAIFVEEAEEVPEGATVVFSAHGVAPTVHAEAAGPVAQDDRRHLPAGDQGAPGGAAVRGRRPRHRADRARGARGGRGHHGPGPGEHPPRRRRRGGRQVEVRDPAKVAYLSQTTLSVDETNVTVEALRQRFPLLQGPPSADICYATQNRQVAVKEIAVESDLVLVVGSRNSSNSVRLVEVALDAGAGPPTWSTTPARSTRRGSRA
jgi:4-hydroxy-3-methylbut-2-enyl diphosphate reductase